MSLFVVVYLSLLLSTTNGNPLQYQDLHVGTLPSSPSFSPDDELSWVLDSESKSIIPDGNASRSSSSGVTLRLHHVDNLLPSTTTPTELLRLRLRRDAARFSAISGVGSNGTVIPRRESFSSSVISGLTHGSGEYFTRIGIGTPATNAYMVLDTGSDVVWVQCAPCRKCYTQTDPVFDPRKSRSFTTISCASRMCRKLDTSGCDGRRKSCVYQVAYGDGSVTTGDFSTETVTFEGGRRIGKVAFGCGHDNEGLFVAAAGLLGLGRGVLSFPSQAGRRGYGRRFSYCLVDRTSSVAPRQQSSTVVFGDAAVPGSRTTTIYTPLLTNPKLDTFYYAELIGVSVGGTRVPGVLASDLRLNPTTGRGGVIVDSGTSVTRLARPAYAALRDAFRSGAAGLKPAAGFSLFDTCFDLSGKTEVKVPTVVLHFASTSKNGAPTSKVSTSDLSLPAENYLIPVDTSGVFCFAFAGTDSGISIIGNIQQQGFRVVFDGARSRVGFSPHSC